MKTKTRISEASHENPAARRALAGACAALIACLITSLTASFGALTSVAHADSVNVQGFRSNSNLRYTLSENGIAERPPGYDESTPYRRYFLGVDYSYLDDPLVVLTADRSERVGTLATGMHTFGLTGGIDFNGDFTLNVTLPLHIVSTSGGATSTSTTPGSSATSGTGQSSQFTAGDVRLFSKIFLNKPAADEVGFSLIPEIQLPTGSSTLFTSDASLGFGLSGAAEYDFGSFRTTANLGYRNASGAQFRDMDYRHRLPIALGVMIPLTEQWSINTEGAGSVILPFNRYHNPSELYAGVKYAFKPDLVGSAGGSIGALNGVASSDYRLLLTLKYYPFEPASAAVVETPPPSPAPTPAPTPVAAPAKPVPVKPLLAARNEVPMVEFTAKRINIRDEIKFKHNSAVLTGQGRAILDLVADEMKRNRSSYKLIEVEGHTNMIGSDAYNMKLSKNRAASVKRYLVSRGIEANTLKAIGYGKRRPKQLREGVSKSRWLTANRRVEFKVLN